MYVTHAFCCTFSSTTPPTHNNNDSSSKLVSNNNKKKNQQKQLITTTTATTTTATTPTATTTTATTTTTTTATTTTTTTTTAHPNAQHGPNWKTTKPIQFRSFFWSAFTKIYRWGWEASHGQSWTFATTYLLILGSTFPFRAFGVEDGWWVSCCFWKIEAKWKIGVSGRFVLVSVFGVLSLTQSNHCWHFFWHAKVLKHENKVCVLWHCCLTLEVAQDRLISMAKSMNSSWWTLKFCGSFGYLKPPKPLVTVIWCAV